MDIKTLKVNGIEQIDPPHSQYIRNGELVEGVTHFAPLYVPKKGDTLDIASAPIREFIFYKHLIHQEHPYAKITEKFGVTVDGVDYTDSTLHIKNVNPNHPVMKRLGLMNGSNITFGELEYEFKKLNSYGDWTNYRYYLDMWRVVINHVTGSENIEFTHHLFMDGDEITKYVTKWESYFMMGDNRDNSADSRYWGFVNRNFIKAKAAIIYFSLDKEVPFYLLPAKIRWNRLGKLIRNWDGMPEQPITTEVKPTPKIETTPEVEITENTPAVDSTKEIEPTSKIETTTESL